MLVRHNLLGGDTHKGIAKNIASAAWWLEIFCFWLIFMYLVNTVGEDVSM